LGWSVIEPKMPSVHLLTKPEQQKTITCIQGNSLTLIQVFIIYALDGTAHQALGSFRRILMKATSTTLQACISICIATQIL
jgi:hypothetical protein